ncbi:selenocysteine-specific translation elongation factor [Streptomyces cyslabdanicus]|uniref:selenocysteine-specific translation elongation factor n=1 Tax=Streptomyces cyslabdanicus TaxID=1470456 RepID=UPI004043FAA8
MRVIATAGHVDHGKSTLLRKLTDMDPDRWDEERRRGMTLDLGFVWTTLPNSGPTIAFVDVPGHERYVGNMLAGIGPAPAVLLVVAADEGWCRQTEEHVAALRALGIRHGVLAVTRSDLGDADLATAEAHDRLADTDLLHGLETVAVSAVTGSGLGELRAALRRLDQRLPAPSEDGPERLWIDRAFTVRGSGIVATGTLTSGSMQVGDELRAEPTGDTVRIRAMECLKQPVPQASAVSRVAVNLRGDGASRLRRGHVLVRPGQWATGTVWDVRLLHAGERIPEQVVVHLGSAALPARVRVLPGVTPSAARLTLATPVPVHLGERVVLRDPGGQQILTGAIVLDVAPPKLRRRGAAASRARELAVLPEVPSLQSELARRGTVRRAWATETGLLPGGTPAPRYAMPIGDWLIHRPRWERWTCELTEAVDKWAVQHPIAPALPRHAACEALGLPIPELLTPLTSAADLIIGAFGVSRPDAKVVFTPAVEKALRTLTEQLRSAPFAPPTAAELVESGLGPAELAAAVREGLLLRITDGIHLLPDALDEAVRRMAELPPQFTVSDVRRMLCSSRRVVLPLLELLDRSGTTRRIDTIHRELRSRCSDR